MTAPLPLTYNGEGEFSTPRGWRLKADAAYVIGQVYLVQPIEQRSAKAHARFFAIVGEYWATLPEDRAGQFPSPDHLRKHALCRTGYCDERKVVCANNREALQCAAMAGEMDSYAVVSVVGNVVTIWRAHTQSTRAMDKKTFQESADKVLFWIEHECLGLHRVAA
jgi:hypothetical protein